jgi:hypothetical protein
MLRVPLTSISGKHVRKTELISHQREVIIGANAVGVSSGRIHMLSNFSDSVAYHLEKKLLNKKTAHSNFATADPGY